MKKIVLAMGFVTFVLNCASGGVQFSKGSVYNPETTKVVTMAVFDMSTNSTADSSDESNKIFGSIAQAEVGDIYGNLIPGGELTIKAAEAIGVKKDLDSAIGKLTEAIVNSNSVDPNTTKVFSKIAKKMGVEALAFPLVSGNKDKMVSGEGVVYRFVVYDVRNPGIQYVAETNPVTVNSFMYDKSNDAQKKSMVSASATKAVNDLFGTVKEEISKLKK